jgi:hypothetical protein
MSERPDTGDVVRVPSIGEEWIVAYVEGDYLYCCGWPLTGVRLSQVELVERATPERRQQLLEDMAKSSCDMRSLHARHRLGIAS